jgi:transposase
VTAAIELPPNDLPTALTIINELTLKNQELRQQLDWFYRQLFGEKSEKVIREFPGSKQLWLGGEAPEAQEGEAATVTVKEHARRRHGKQALEDDCGESGLRFDSTVPVEEIPCPPAEIAGLSPEDYDIIDTKYTERLCQRSGSYYIKRFVRPVVKLKESGKVTNHPAPPSVLERSYADETLLAGVLVDKFQYHLPLYRQHQRMIQAGIMIARGNLTHWVHKSAALLEPIYLAVLASVLTSEVLALDETPLKAGQEKKGKLHRGYIWALYGDEDEVLFLYSPTRASAAIEPHIKSFCGTLVTDGYTVYDKLCARYEQIIHALCWAHTRREFFEAQKYEPDRCGKALDHIGKLYEEEAKIRELKLVEAKKLKHRVEYERPVVDQFFEWLKTEVLNSALLPSNRFHKAAAYALEREEGLRVYLADPAVPIDTNHLEREIRPLPLGRKNWLFCWTEVGAHAVAIIQTLIGCCRLHGLNPFDYFASVLPRLDSQPAAKVAELTPRNWAAALKLKA